MKLQDDYLERLSLRFLQDALASATRSYWLRRAEEIERCRPRPGDYNGQATSEALAERDARLVADALECRRHAELFDHIEVDEELIAEVLGYDLVVDVPERMAA